MHSNITKRLVMFLSIFTIGLPFASAQTAFGNLGTSIQNVFSPILMSFGSGSFEFWGKILLWILIFALLYGVSSIVPILKSNRNISIAVSMILALMSVLPLKEPLIRALFQSYSIAISFLLIALPVVAVIYITHKLFKDPKRFHYALKAVSFYIIAVIISNVVGKAEASFDLGFSSGFTNMGGFLIGVCFIMFLWNLIRAILGGEEDQHNVQGVAGGGLDWLKDLFGGSPSTSSSPQGKPLPPNLRKALDVIYSSIKEFENAYNLLPSEMNKLLTQRRMQLFPFPRGTPFNPTLLNRYTTSVRNITNDLNARGKGINDMITKLKNDHPDMSPRDEIKLADHVGLWAAKLLTYNHYLTRARASYARGGGPI